MSVTVLSVLNDKVRNGACPWGSELDLDSDRSVVDRVAPTVPQLDLAVASDRGDGLAISLLGTFAFRAGDRPLLVNEGSRKLLALLALREQPMPRALAAFTLWPDAPERDAMARLRSALCRVKNTIGDVIDVASLDMQLRPEVFVDLRASRNLVHGLLDGPATASAVSSAASAVNMLSGDLLPGWRDEWVLADGDEWHQLRLHALEAMAAHMVADGRCADATLAALAAVRAEPLRESARGALIKTYIAEGNQNEALSEYDRFRDRLQAHAGIEPTPMLAGLVGDLRRPR